MDFYELLDDVLKLLHQRGRVTYRALKRQFHLDDDVLDDLKEELIKAQRVAVDENGDVLVWLGDVGSTSAPTPPAPQPVQRPPAEVDRTAPIEAPVAKTHAPEAERRQLTVLFCDLVDSTMLASQLDPEDWREVVRAYQDTCAKVIQRYEGYIAQYLGDGLLVYFGYPLAHEDDAQRAVRAGLGMVEALSQLNTRLERERGVHLAVRIGIHTGLVVVGEMGGGSRQEYLALGDTPNVAARLQGLAAPDTVVISAATHRLVQGYFTAADLGPQTLKGVAAPMPVYHILGASPAQSRLEVAAPTGLTPLVGRESEVALLLERWAQSQAGLGQVVLLSGEAGIGKSRLVEVLRERALSQGATRLVFRCSPYHQQSALFPVIEHLQQVLAWGRDDTPAAKLDMLERTLQAHGLAPDEAVPLVAALLSVPIPAGRYPAVALTPQQQRQQTMGAVVAWLLADAGRQAILAIWEDLHWADPSTLELLGLIIDRVPTARLLMLMTARPEFRPPWAPRSHLTQLTLGRLTRAQVETMVRQLTGGKPLPAEVLAQVVAKTDGVPLFIEELVKMLLESGLMQEEAECYALTGPLPPLAIPSTLHDSLMARLDRLATAKAVAQLGAVLGREFAYELIRAVAPMDEATVQQGLAQLVDAELLYQRGSPLPTQYLFKHALIQETAYQSLLKSTRQHYHQRSAQVLATQFPEVVETQPELVARHYTEAGLTEQAIPHWQRAAQQALQRSANPEAIDHSRTALELLKTLPQLPNRDQQELDLQIILGRSLMATQGFAAPEAESAYARARELCEEIGDSPQLFPVLHGMWRLYVNRPELHRARESGEQLLALAERGQDPTLLLEAHRVLGQTKFWLGAIVATRAHMTQAMTIYDSQQQHPPYIALFGQHPGVTCQAFMAWALWMLGYPDQALQKTHRALTLSQEVDYPFTRAFSLACEAMLHRFRREAQAAGERAEDLIALSQQYGFAYWLPWGVILRGWALAKQQQAADGLAEIRRGLAAYQATRAEIFRPSFLGLLAETYGEVGQPKEGLGVLVDAFAAVDAHGERWWEAELHRLNAELLLPLSGNNHNEAEIRCHRALDVARRQPAKSLELRAAMSLARLWQQQGKRAEAHALLAPIYDWFTEGLDTADLQEAKALLDEWS
jgi:class 3 adenylate cyclase/predicted ATPase